MLESLSLPCSWSAPSANRFLEIENTFDYMGDVHLRIFSNNGSQFFWLNQHTARQLRDHLSALLDKQETAPAPQQKRKMLDENTPVGAKLLCIDTSNIVNRGRLTEGKTYTHLGMGHVIDDTGTRCGFFFHRFEVIDEAPAEPAKPVVPPLSDEEITKVRALISPPVPLSRSNVKPGQRVRCIDSFGSGRALEEGALYTVRCVDENDRDLVLLQEVSRPADTGFLMSRFVLA